MSTFQYYEQLQNKHPHRHISMHTSILISSRSLFLETPSLALGTPISQGSLSPFVDGLWGVLTSPVSLLCILSLADLGSTGLHLSFTSLPPAQTSLLNFIY